MSDNENDTLYVVISPNTWERIKPVVGSVSNVIFAHKAPEGAQSVVLGERDGQLKFTGVPHSHRSKVRSFIVQLQKKGLNVLSL